MNYRIKWLSSICSAALMLALVTSCADGVDDNERFSAGAGVTNAQLEAPTLSLENLKVQTSADGSQNVDVSWPVVYGAGGYLANVKIVNDPEHPIALVTDSVIDGCHFSFPREVDTKYEISVGTLENKKLNNKGSLEPSFLVYSTMLPAVTIPYGNEISAFIAANLPDGSTEEIAFELEAGRTYQLNAEANCKLANVTIRGDRYSRPLVEITGDAGGFVTQNGLTLRNIDFDMSDASDKLSLIMLNPNPDQMFSTEALGLKALSSDVKDGFICQNPISIESCNVRNIPNSIIWTPALPDQTKGWGLKTVRIDNCVMQFNKKTSQAAISLEDNWGVSGIELMTLSNNTFYSIIPCKARFLRYGARTQPVKIFGPGSSTNHTLSHCTFYKTFTDDQFANNMDNSGLVAKIDHCIFYDINRFDQYCFRSGTSQESSDNVSWLAGSEPNLHSNIAKMSEIVDPDFVGPTDEMFDLNTPKGGVDFRPQAAICVQNNIGDPRWFE